MGIGSEEQSRGGQPGEAKGGGLLVLMGLCAFHDIQIAFFERFWLPQMELLLLLLLLLPFLSRTPAVLLFDE